MFLNSGVLGSLGRAPGLLRALLFRVQVQGFRILGFEDLGFKGFGLAAFGLGVGRRRLRVKGLGFRV